MARLGWGMIGGGEGSQIGPAHRMAAGLDGLFDLRAAALDHRAEAGAASPAGWAWQRTAPMATGARCSRASAGARTGSTW